MNGQIRRVAVWSGWLRLSHAALAIATLVLLATGWLIAGSPVLAAPAADIHFIAASVLIAALLLRVLLGFTGKGPEGFAQMLPRRADLAGMRASLLFYLSLGRAPMPNWFAHNPLWKPVYLILFFLLILSAASGWVMPEMQLIGRLYLPRLHIWLSDVIALIVAAHLFSVVLQDIRGTTADISAMLSGHRYFSIDRGRGVRPPEKSVSISLDDIGGS